MSEIDRHLLVRMPARKAAALWASSRGLPPPSRATVVRWIVTGVRGIRLAGERFGVRWYCRPADVLHFHTRLAESNAGSARQGGAA